MLWQPISQPRRFRPCGFVGVPFAGLSIDPFVGEKRPGRRPT
ncbi:hypothetical protein SAMN05421684_5199 [Asanoa ishikariensis]|uniref:Uncharacterized protein n=1 Tax=Asanoa ishikariensis TaxID=137265 RepID=A0A1H3T5G8_9ACTN|nr:hypothetical protein SAMN05421684_5199 [Asanoa ishikariensis]